MPTIKIDNAASIDEFTSANAIDAVGGGSLTIDVDAFVVASGNTFNGAVLGAPGAWTVKIDGLLASTAAPTSVGLNLGAATTMTVSDTGAVLSTGNAVIAAGGLTLTNAGSIESIAGIYQSAGAGAMTVVNSGTIVANGHAYSTITNFGTTTKITNSGEIRNDAGGAYAIAALGANASDTLINSGRIVGNVQLASGKNTVTSTGVIEGALIMGDDDDKLTHAHGKQEGGLDVVMMAGGKDTADNKGYIFALDLGEGDNKLTNAGSIGRYSPSSGGVAAGAGSDTVTNSGYITGLFNLGEGNNKVTNAVSGTIGVKVEVGGGNDTIINNGFFTTDVALGAGLNTLTNTSSINGGVSAGQGDDKITNSGQGNIVGGLALGDGRNVVTNSARIGGGITAGEHDDKIVNSGTIYGGVILGKGNNSVANSSVIEGLSFAEGNDTVTNTGDMHNGVILGDGVNTLTSSGRIYGDISGGQHVDTLNISGSVSGNIFLGDGADKVTLSGKAIIYGDIDLGLGDDTYVGSEVGNAINDSAGSDSFALGGGDDLFLAGAVGDGTDGVDAGAGSDWYSAEAATSDLLVNIGADFTHEVLVGTIAKNKSTGNGTDNISNFENVIGGQSHDKIIGSSAANELRGGNGGDMLFGREGNDLLVGGNDNSKDRLRGGLGADVLWGGDDRHGIDAAVDFFLYDSISDSTVALAGRDKIMDFASGTDQIDLSAIDANSKNGAASNDAFNWLGLNGKFTGAGGELMYMNLATDWTVLYGDTNGDKKADFAISLNGNLTLVVSDISL